MVILCMELVDVAQAAHLIRPPALHMCMYSLQYSHGRDAHTDKAGQLETNLM